MKHVATIEIYALDQGGFKADVYRPTEPSNAVEVYADKPASFLVRIGKAVKAMLGWK